MDEIKNENKNSRSENNENTTGYDEENMNAGDEAEENDHTGKNETGERKHADKSHLNKDTAKLEKALEKAIEERDSFKDLYLRTFSDYNNYKKRNQDLTYNAVKTGACDAIEKILPVLDNLERALEHMNEENEDAVSKGVAMVYKQLSDIITGMGIKEIPAQGKQFDPNLHHAIQQVEAKEGEEPGTIAAVAQKGYLMDDDRVLRHSMVVVNK